MNQIPVSTDVTLTEYIIIYSDRVVFKIVLITNKALHGQAPALQFSFNAYHFHRL